VFVSLKVKRTLNVAEPPPGLIFVLFDHGGDTYLFEGQYEDAFLVEGE